MTMDVTAHCAAIVRDGDRDRYLADLFAPETARRHLLALHAFDVEVATVRDKVSDPTLGEIRLEWWRQALRGEHGGHPVAATLAETIARLRLPIESFDNLLQARIFDLYDDPMPSLTDLEGYAGDTTSAMFQIGAMILADGADPGTADGAGFGGVAATVTRVLRALPADIGAGRCFLPADRLAAAGVSPAGLRQDEARPAIAQVAGELRRLAATRLAEAKQALAGCERGLLPAFLPLAIVEPTLDRMARPDFSPLRDVVEFSPLRRQWLLWRAARRGRL